MESQRGSCLTAVTHTIVDARWEPARLHTYSWGAADWEVTHIWMHDEMWELLCWRLARIGCVRRC